ncbi:hypothetical protein ACIRF8_08675 [Streptomyces sp. NPDC102406]|uniref:hypothetical protein n=1 Tax=Streptomyces sp. NPDC102406 TaxID=3366171 RepID=UPI003805BD9A
MRLTDITATAHPAGNRIDLSWHNPDPGRAPGIRVVRREGTHPTGPDDGRLIAHTIGPDTRTVDTGLRGGTVYYYTLFPFSGSPVPTYDPDPHNHASAMATSRYDFAGLLYGMLPAIYRRYDADRTPVAGSGLPADRDKGQLRRFLDLPGGELDRIYSLVRAGLDLGDLDRVDGRLLPLLAQWIGWQTDFGLPVDAQRNEVRFAPRIYRTIGGVPTLDATVARVTGWTSRTKEYVHNVARTNQPERLNLWSALRDASGVFAPAALASVNFAHDGRPVALREADGSSLFFFHTRRPHGWDIWMKRFAGGLWEPSAPRVDRPGIDKHPSVAVQGGGIVWLFWQGYDPEQPPADRKWRIWYSVRTGPATWSAPAVFGDTATERRMPTAVADNAGGLWLFWLEAVGDGWELRYNRNVGGAWLPAPLTLPADGGRPPRVEDDLFVLFHPTSTTQRLWLFWARHESGGPPGQSRWSIVHRVKAGLDPAVSDWSPIRALPKAGADYHDRQPAALLTADGNIEVFWSSTQNGGWSLSRNVLAVTPLTWGVNQRIGGGPYARRGPYAVDTPSGTLLVHRSNESLEYASADYGATRTVDHRYAGTTTVDATGAAKLGLRGRFEDFQTYTYDAGAGGVRTNDDRIGRDTVGLFLAPPGTADPDQVKAMVSRLAGVLADAMPVTARPVFIIP